MNFSTGAYNSSGGTASITDLVDFSPVGDGWYKLTIRGSLNTSTLATVFVSASGAGQDLAVWRPDLRLTADAIPSIPAYQRVTSATDYDDVGFPVYWRGQTDDWAKTRINPSGATKALVMWAGQKMAAGTSVLLESSSNSGLTTGTLGMIVDSGLADSLLIRSRGDASAVDARAAVNPSVARRVFRGVASISADVTELWSNGVVSASSTTDQGTGSYTEQDVYFGARTGTSLFANIREYAPPLILFQPTADTGLSASQITALDKAYAKAAGVTL